MRKIIFLDIDGVLCLYWGSQTDWRQNQNKVFNEHCCKNLKEVLDTTGAKIVLISSWRLFEEHLENCYRQLEKHGISKNYIVGCTADLSSQGIEGHLELRRREIEDYTKKHGITNYVILDDFAIDDCRLVKTNMHYGLTETQKTDCIAKLKKAEI
jgi:hypothetical protein